MLVVLTTSLSIKGLTLCQNKVTCRLSLGSTIWRRPRGQS